MRVLALLLQPRLFDALGDAERLDVARDPLENPLAWPMAPSLDGAIRKVLSQIARQF